MTVTWEELNYLFSIDPDAGTIKWKNPPGKKSEWLYGKPAGNFGHIFGYVNVCINKKDYKRHRLIWFYVHRKWPPSDLDHINGVRNDDRISNLRLATRSQNCWNSAKPSTNKSGHKGVSWSKEKRKWRASIRCENKWSHLGYFDNIDDALIARLSAEQRLHKGFSKNVTDRSIGCAYRNIR